MGCGNNKEKLENEMIKLKFQRVQIQMERKNQIKILEGIEKKKITEPNIPDYISFKPERREKKLLTDINKKNENKKKKDKNNKEDKTNKKEKNEKDNNKKRFKSENAKNKKSESTGLESKKNAKAKIIKKQK